MSIETTVNRNLLRYAVQRAITCPYSGVVLDVRQAVTVEVNGQDYGVMAADHWDTVASALTQLCEEKGLTLTVVDGRELYGPENNK